MLSIKKLTVKVEDKQVLQNISMDFEKGKNYCILGKNGSGKSSLALATMGHPNYEISSGDIHINGQSILEMEADERASEGVFLAFQKIPEIKWVKLFEFLRTIYNAKHDVDEKFLAFKKIILPMLAELDIDKEFLRRDLNVGFSGGERRKIEILQLKLLQPTYIFLDEVDSGLDVDAFKMVAELLKQANTAANSFIIITHYFNILDYIPIDYVYVLDQGQIIKQGDPSIAHKIKNKGFEDL